MVLNNINALEALQNMAGANNNKIIDPSSLKKSGKADNDSSDDTSISAFLIFLMAFIANIDNQLKKLGAKDSENIYSEFQTTNTKWQDTIDQLNQLTADKNLTAGSTALKALQNEQNECSLQAQQQQQDMKIEWESKEETYANEQVSNMQSGYNFINDFQGFARQVI